MVLKSTGKRGAIVEPEKDSIVRTFHHFPIMKHTCSCLILTTEDEVSSTPVLPSSRNE